ARSGPVLLTGTHALVRLPMLRQVEAIAIDTGLSALWFTVWEDNADALAFYAAQGYAAKGAATYSFRGRQYRNHVMAKALPDGAARDAET
ncbi:MAG: hypothetical protein ACKPB8_06260, partial [Alphaproteobacteria bacterium]